MEGFYKIVPVFKNGNPNLVETCPFPWELVQKTEKN